MARNHEISHELKDLVSGSVRLLGMAIQDMYGEEMYLKIEQLRREMKDIREKGPETVHRHLEEVYQRLSGMKTPDLHKVSKSYSLMLELINACEAAYRIFRLQDERYSQTKAPHSLVFVFTSHPTEARSKNFLELMDKIEELLLASLHLGLESHQEQLTHLFRIALRLDLANNRRPQVEDEAEQIYHTVLSTETLKEQVELRKKGINVFFRTWVGGDKDGHPKVGPVTMLKSLTLSRSRLIAFINTKLTEFMDDVLLLGDNDLVEDIKALRRKLPALKRVAGADGVQIKDFKKHLQRIKQKSDKQKFTGPDLEAVENLLWLYPALVLPLEIREDSSFIHEALEKPRMNIARMLAQLKKISKGMEAKWYVRGFIISMCQTADDMKAATKLVTRMTGSLSIPVVPLFENEKGLKNAVDILKGAFESYDYPKRHHEKWGGRFEVMLGYSDSSKENGVFPGRMMVETALLNLEKFLKSQKLTPVFFHGSGGSVSRGGGSIKEQIAWWPQTALNIYKVTVQGETVQRHFHNPLIIRSQVSKIVEAFSNYKPHKHEKVEVLDKLAIKIQGHYRALVQDPDFQHMTSEATPYDFLSLLKIGSRPTKRAGKGKFTLRAIPWILCWTQTRVLLPVWWGLGSAWSEMSSSEQKQIKQSFNSAPLFQSYVKNLGFTLSKVELGVWKFHLSHSRLSETEKKMWNDKIESELLLVQKFFKDVMGHQNYTWFNPRLGESIYFRSSMIHPLNVIQKISLERNDRILLRETVTGIASGMLTTG